MMVGFQVSGSGRPGCRVGTCRMVWGDSRMVWGDGKVRDGEREQGQFGAGRGVGRWGPHWAVQCQWVSQLSS